MRTLQTTPSQGSSHTVKTIAFVLYPEVTALGLVGPLQVLSALGKPYRVTVVAEHTEPMPSDIPLMLKADRTFDDVPKPFAIVVPGGVTGPFKAMTNRALMSYLHKSAASAEVVASVCTGSLVLAAAGILQGRQATTHWAMRTHLEKLGVRYVKERWVEDGKFITSAGISAGIDMALHLAARLTSEENARRIQAGLEYDPAPPLGSLRPEHTTWNEFERFMKNWLASSTPYPGRVMNTRFGVMMNVARSLIRSPALFHKLLRP